MIVADPRIRPNCPGSLAPNGWHGGRAGLYWKSSQGWWPGKCEGVFFGVGHRIFGRVARPPCRQRPGPVVRPQRADDRGLFGRGGSDLLAGARVEAGLRPRRTAVVVQGAPELVRLAHSPRPRCGPARLRRPSADDEDGTADDLLAGRRR